MKRSAVVLAVTLTWVGTAHGGPIADRMMQSLQLQEDAQGALNLQQQQRAYRREVGKLSPSQRMGLEQRQRQQADTALGIQRAVPGHRSAGQGAARAQQDLIEQQVQQLHFRIQQSTWPYGYNPPPPPARPTPGPLDNRGLFR
jgi:hypothetical protein